MAKLLPNYLTAVAGLPFSFTFGSESRVATTDGLPQKLKLNYLQNKDGLYYYKIEGIPVATGAFDINVSLEDGDSFSLKLIVGLEIG